MLEAWGVVDGVPERAMEVHRDHSDGRLLLRRQSIQPRPDRGFVAALADPDGLTRGQVADDRDEQLQYTTRGARDRPFAPPLTITIPLKIVGAPHISADCRTLYFAGSPDGMKFGIYVLRR